LISLILHCADGSTQARKKGWKNAVCVDYWPFDYTAMEKDPLEG
jgi:hypothetical protein